MTVLEGRVNNPVSWEKPKYVYVASSWRNPIQIAVCAALRSAGIGHYDFKNPPHGEGGFHWSQVMPSYSQDSAGDQLADVTDYLECLGHPVAEAGYRSDFHAMEQADCGILVLPCGRSAHLEIGWMAGQTDKRTAIMLDPDVNTGKITPELMYKMVDYISPSLFDLLGWLGVED